MGVCFSQEGRGGGVAGARTAGGDNNTVIDPTALLGMLVTRDPSTTAARRNRAGTNNNTAAAGEEFLSGIPDAAFNTQAQSTIPAVVRMFSGCKDSQTSADVSDVSSFGLPPVSDAEKAGGACTNGLLMTLKNSPEGSLSFADLLTKMQATLKERGYKQIPQLTSSRNCHLKKDKFSVWNPQQPSQQDKRHRAVLIGINYKGHEQGVLNGCVNDVKAMQQYLQSQGFQSDAAHMRILTDDKAFSPIVPTGQNILAAMQFLVEGAQAGDSLFFHYSGHGAQTRDTTGDEADGFDETLVPLDYQENGMITDDTIFQMLVAKLPAGVQMTCVFDCCHSGTVMDLPFIFSATEQQLQTLQEAGSEVSDSAAGSMFVNPGFNFDMAKKLIAMAAKGVLNQIIKSQFSQQAGAGGAGNRAGGGLVPGGALQKEMLGMASAFLSQK